MIDFENQKLMSLPICFSKEDGISWNEIMNFIDGSFSFNQFNFAKKMTNIFLYNGDEMASKSEILMFVADPVLLSFILNDQVFNMLSQMTDENIFKLIENRIDKTVLS